MTEPIAISDRLLEQADRRIAALEGARKEIHRITLRFRHEAPITHEECVMLRNSMKEIRKIVEREALKEKP